MNDLITSGREPLLLVNGEQFFGGYRGKYAVESSYPLDMDWLLASVRASGRASGFISGDVHFSEFMELEPELIGQLSVEITSSSMHSVTYPGQHERYTNPRRRAATSSHNFVLLDLHIDEGIVTGQAASIGTDGRLLFQRNLQIGGTERVVARTPGLKVMPVPDQSLRQKFEFPARAPASERIH